MTDKLAVTQTKLQNPNDSREELIIKQAKAEFQAASDHWGPFREKAEDCLSFLSSEYLDFEYMNNREAVGLPVLSENRIPAFVETVVTSLRQNQPGIQVDSGSESTDPKFAQTMSDSIRGIEQDPEAKASIAYEKAEWYAIGTGMGFARILNKYVSDDSFEQKLIIAPIEDPFTVYPDPAHKCLVGSDQEYCFVVADLTHDAYLRKYGKGKMYDAIQSARVHGWDQESVKNSNKWIAENTVRVAEYYVKEYYKRTIYQVFDRSIGAMKVVHEKPQPGEHLVLEDTRELQYAVIKRYVLNDKEILEESEWPGRFIPIGICKGIEFWNSSKRYLKGMIDDMRDPQKRLDFFINWQAEIMSMAPKAPYIGTAIQFQDNPDDWRDINNSNIAFITYLPDPKAPGRPERDVADVPIAGSQQLYMNAVEGLKAVTGMQAPMVGDANNPNGNEAESGKALLTRKESSRDATFHFMSNIRHFIAHIGTLILEAKPTFYSEAGRRVMAQKRDGTQYMARLNDSTETMLDAAKFNVRIETGKTYENQQQENMDAGLTLMGAMPEESKNFADLVAAQGQGEFWKQISARLRATVPPNVLQATEEMDAAEAPQMVANLKSQLASLQRNLQTMQQEIQPDKDKIQKLEMEVAFQKQDNHMDVTKATLDHNDKSATLSLEEKKIILEADIRRVELRLEEREIVIKERELELKELEFKRDTIVEAAELASDAMDHHHKVKENIDDGELRSHEISISKPITSGDQNDLDLKASLAPGVEL